MKTTTRTIAAISMFSALAYAAAVMGRIPLVLFLKYDPKDCIIAASGFALGPPASCAVALVVSLSEMVTVSESGILGCMMNVISSCSFACPAAFVYRRRRTHLGAAAGLLCGWGCMISAMLLWNYLIAPVYMGYPRESVVKLLLPVFLPFNLIKGGLNTAITVLLYDPLASAWRHSHRLGREPAAAGSHTSAGLLLAALLVLAVCVVSALLFHRTF